jgi:hypothetical protein
MVKESQLEHRILKYSTVVKCRPGTQYLRRCGMGRGFGAIDLVLLPKNGRRRVILVEAKRVSSADATSKVVGQLLMYYAAALAIGHHGVRRLHRYCEVHAVAAKSTKMKSLQALAGGVRGSENAARLIRHGRRLRPDEIGLCLVLDKKPRATLLSLTKALRQHGLKIDILVAKSNGVSVCRSV